MKILLKLCLMGAFLSHLVIVMVLYAGAFYTLLKDGFTWYWIVCLAFVIRLPSTLGRCPLTELENAIRDRLGKPKIKFFDYFKSLTPWKSLISK